MQIHFLGTSCQVPTKERNVSGTFLKYKSEGILFDCGEGTQRQMNITGIKRTSVTKILVSHWHGDHVAGMIGLIQTISDKENPPKIKVYGPRDTKRRMQHLMSAAIFDPTSVQLEVHELNPKGVEMFFENTDFKLLCAQLQHSAPSIGFAFIEKDRLNVNTQYLRKQGVPDGPHLRTLKDGKSITYKGKNIDVKDATYMVEGKKIVYALDTEPCKSIIKLAEGADLFITEATYTHSLVSKARQNKHMTAKEAATIANNANVKKLVLTHFSQRYKNSLDIQEEAQQFFDNVICAEDFMKIRL